jgi:hypothetical protein
VSAIPPHLIGSVLQSPLAQRQQARVDEADAHRAAAASRELAARDAAADTQVETADADARIHADSGGQGGGQGRAFEDLEDQLDGPSADVPPAADDEGEPEGEGRLDITA